MNKPKGIEEILNKYLMNVAAANPEKWKEAMTIFKADIHKLIQESMPPRGLHNHPSNIDQMNFLCQVCKEQEIRNQAIQDCLSALDKVMGVKTKRGGAKK